MTNLDRFLVMCGNAAKQLGITNVVIAARDPASNAAKLVASQGSMDDLKPLIAEKFGLETPPDTSWE
jgi:hypothetical protein